MNYGEGMPKISLIIPVYNTEKYLPECLDSCINQSLTDIEIICIDDCSSDSSFDILTTYQNKDKRIRVFRQEKNQRQGAARNRGISEALGEYVWFVDSDDFLDKNACQLLYDIAKENEAEILCFEGISFKDLNGRQFIESSYFTDWPKNVNLSPRTSYQGLKGYFSVSPCIYITKRDYLRNFKFRTDCYYEDTDFTPILFALSSCLRCVNYTAYYRRITSVSTTHIPLSEKIIHDKICPALELQNFITKNKISRKHFLYKFFIAYTNYLLDEIKKSNINFTNKTFFETFIKKAKFIIAKNIIRSIFMYPLKILVKIFNTIIGEF